MSSFYWILKKGSRHSSYLPVWTAWEPHWFWEFRSLCWRCSQSPGPAMTRPGSGGGWWAASIGNNRLHQAPWRVAAAGDESRGGGKIPAEIAAESSPSYLCWGVQILKVRGRLFFGNKWRWITKLKSSPTSDKPHSGGIAGTSQKCGHDCRENSGATHSRRSHRATYAAREMAVGFHRFVGALQIRGEKIIESTKNVWHLA